MRLQFSITICLCLYCRVVCSDKSSLSAVFAFAVLEPIVLSQR